MTKNVSLTAMVEIKTATKFAMVQIAVLLQRSILRSKHDFSSDLHPLFRCPN